MAQMTRTHARVCLFWLSLILHPILGIKLPKNPNFWGVNRHFPAKRVKYWNVHIIKTTASIITKWRCVSTLWTIINNKILRFQKSKMAAAAILKILKNAISLQRNDWLWRNLAQLCVLTLQTPSVNNISQIWKSKMAAAAIFKDRNILISSQPIDRFWQNLTRRCASNLCILVINKISMEKS